ncbi:hypothetical protein F5Y18DRAFT_425900 [Xylariaceae sp. FL1019]|nr:hypothetical protein F5Y18DRAFT_425900 [Xylariaceae sp. FL1019]
MATGQPALTSLGRPKPAVSPPPQAHGRNTSVQGGGSPPVEFRGFDFFAQREFNQLKDASRVYFGATAAEKQGHGGSASWLGDVTPPGTAHRSLDELPPPPGTFPIPPSGKTPRRQRRILGLRRPIFWTLVGILLLIIIVAIGVGAGVGASSTHTTGHAAGSSASSSSTSTATSMDPGIATDGPSTASSTSKPSSTSAHSSSSTPSATSTPGVVVNSGCPKANNTVYTVPGSTKQFLRFCGVDYSGSGAVDIKNVQTISATECIANCAGTKGCTGAGWGYIEGDEGSSHACYLKKDLTQSHDADANWAFAILL